MSDQIQNVWLTGGLIDPPDAPFPGAVGDFDVFFQWDIQTNTASGMSPSCRQFPGPETFTTSIFQNTIQVQGTCGINLFFGGSVVEGQYDPAHFWIGQVFAQDPPAVGIPTPGMWSLILLAAAVLGLRRYRRPFLQEG